MSQAQLPYVLLYLCSTFLSAVSQVLLKKAALREHKSVLAEYTDWRVDFRLCPLCGLHALNDAGLQGRTAQRRACTGSNRLYLRHDFWRYDLPREDEP